MARHRRRSRYVCGAVLMLSIAATPAVAQTADECAALNGVRYSSPSTASGAQYVGVSGACTASDDPNADVTIVPVGGGSGDAGPRGGAPASGGASGSDGATGSPAGGGTAPAPGGTQGGSERGGAGSGDGVGGGLPDTPSPGDTADSGTAATASMRVEQALTTTDDAPPSFISAESLLSAQVGVPLLIGLGLVGTAVALRRRRSA